MPKLSRPISVLAAGGTIAMTPGQAGSGAAPTLGADALVSAVPGLEVDEVRTARSLPGVQLALEDAVTIVRRAAEEAARGHGVVLTTGADGPPNLRDAVAATVRPERGALLHETYGFHGAEQVSARPVFSMPPGCLPGPRACGCSPPSAPV